MVLSGVVDVDADADADADADEHRSADQLGQHRHDPFEEIMGLREICRQDEAQGLHGVEYRSALHRGPSRDGVEAGGILARFSRPLGEVEQDGERGSTKLVRQRSIAARHPLCQGGGEGQVSASPARRPDCPSVFPLGRIAP